MKLLQIKDMGGAYVCIPINNISLIRGNEKGCVITPTTGLLIYTNESYDSVVKKIGGKQ